MSFEEYLISKKIDSASWKLADPVLWNEWSQLFEQMSPASFTSQKLYLINPMRRKFTLKEASVPEKKTETVASSIDTTVTSTAASRPGKPVFKPKIK